MGVGWAGELPGTPPVGVSNPPMYLGRIHLFLAEKVPWVPGQTPQNRPKTPYRAPIPYSIQVITVNDQTEQNNFTPE